MNLSHHDLDFDELVHVDYRLPLPRLGIAQASLALPSLLHRFALRSLNHKLVAQRQ